MTKSRNITVVFLCIYSVFAVVALYYGKSVLPVPVAEDVVRFASPDKVRATVLAFRICFFSMLATRIALHKLHNNVINTGCFIMMEYCIVFPICTIWR